MAKLRLCRVCGAPASELLSRRFCDPCYQKWASEFRRRPDQRERQRVYAAKRYAADPKRIYASTFAWYQRNKTRMHLSRGAASYVLWAIDVGLIEKPGGCERCGHLNIPIQAAHADYGKPFEVEWLCKSCHVLWDRETPKTMPELDMKVF